MDIVNRYDPFVELAYGNLTERSHDRNEKMLLLCRDMVCVSRSASAQASD